MTRIERDTPSEKAEARPTAEQMERLRGMASGAPTWDLSPNDIEALTAALDYIESMEARVRELEHELARRQRWENRAAASEAREARLREALLQIAADPGDSPAAVAIAALSISPDTETETRVIAAFPATGKTYVASRDHRFLDSDSSRFSREAGEWPANYIAHIQTAMAKGEEGILVSTHAEVRRALVEAGIPFTLVYPDPALRSEYRDRMERRGSPPALIEKVIGELWADALADCAAQTGCRHIVLRAGQYLVDVLDRACSPDTETRGSTCADCRREGWDYDLLGGCGHPAPPDTAPPEGRHPLGTFERTKAEQMAASAPPASEGEAATSPRLVRVKPSARIVSYPSSGSSSATSGPHPSRRLAASPRPPIRPRKGARMPDTCPHCGGTPEHPASDPVNGPRVPCCDPIHREGR